MYIQARKYGLGRPILQLPGIMHGVMVGFSSDKINILKHIKCLFSAVALVPGELDGMNTV